MTELLLLIVFLAGLFILQPMSNGLPTKVVAVMAGFYMIIFAVVAGLIARII